MLFDAPVLSAQRCRLHSRKGPAASTIIPSITPNAALTVPPLDCPPHKLWFDESLAMGEGVGKFVVRRGAWTDVTVGVTIPKEVVAPLEGGTGEQSKAVDVRKVSKFGKVVMDEVLVSKALKLSVGSKKKNMSDASPTTPF